MTGTQFHEQSSWHRDAFHTDSSNSSSTYFSWRSAAVVKFVELDAAVRLEKAVNKGVDQAP